MNGSTTATTISISGRKAAARGAIAVRPARSADLERLHALQAFSLRTLGARYYDPAVIESFLRHLGTMDDVLVADGTYFVAEIGGVLAGCGGWSRRPAGYQAAMRAVSPPPSVPKVRSLFVHPAAAGRGVGTAIMDTVEAAVRRAGFDRIALSATLSGERFYAARGYRETGRIALNLPDGAAFPVCNMHKELPNADAAPQRQ